MFVWVAISSTGVLKKSRETENRGLGKSGRWVQVTEESRKGEGLPVYSKDYRELGVVELSKFITDSGEVAPNWIPRAASGSKMEVVYSRTMTFRVERRSKKELASWELDNLFDLEGLRDELSSRDWDEDLSTMEKSKGFELPYRCVCGEWGTEEPDPEAFCPVCYARGRWVAKPEKKPVPSPRRWK